MATAVYGGEPVLKMLVDGVLNTLTEDLDLSYRAQLKGWRFDYLLMWWYRQNYRCR